MALESRGYKYVNSEQTCPQACDIIPQAESVHFGGVGSEDNKHVFPETIIIIDMYDNSTAMVHPQLPSYTLQTLSAQLEH